MTTTNISSGQTSSGGTYGSDDTLNILSGGKAVDAILNGGLEIILGGGATVGTVVNAGGNQFIYSGGAATGTILNPGGLEYVYSGATATGTVLNGGFEQIYTVGVTYGTIVNAGLEYVQGGTAINTVIGSTSSGAHGTETVLSGTTIGTIVNGGQEEVSAGGVTSQATINNGGFENVHSGGTASGTIVNAGGYEVVSSGGIASDTTVNSGGAEVILSGGSATLTDLNVGGTIDVRYLAYAAGGSVSLGANDVLTVSVGGGAYSQHLFGDYTNVDFLLSSDGNGGTNITADVAPCYCRGTRILTDRGEVPVEALRAGDRAVTCAGFGAWMKPIVWVGHTPFDATRHPRPQEVWPIRIREGAFDEGLPWRDLLVSPGHSFLIDGVLIQAAKLVNGATIFQDRTVARGEYFHVEMERHDALLAEGVPAESYLDTGNRKVFASGQAFRELHPDFSGKAWTDTCVPLVMSGPVLEAVRARFQARVEALGYIRRADPDVHLLLEDGRRVDPDLVIGECHHFVLPHPGAARLASRIWTPSRVFPGNGDTRTLGVRVGRVVLDGVRRVPLDDATFAREGWHPEEYLHKQIWRWTDGLARLPRAASSITVDIIPGGRYWVDTMRDKRRAAA